MARIRTVKPEMWGHPVLARKDDSVRLAAIALLNFADDEGYFLADPQLFRSFAFPFDEDSTKARRVLDECSRAGYIEVREHPSHGPVGWVVNFDKHQRVDRKTPSKIKDYFDSSSPRRALDERSSPEQGTGNREQGETPTPAALRLPDAGASKPPAPEKPTDPVKDEIWQTGKAILIESEGMSKDRAGSLLGKLVKDYGQRLVLDAVRDCAKTTPAKPSEWLVARCQERRPAGDALEARNRAVGEAWLAKMQGRAE